MLIVYFNVDIRLLSEFSCKMHSFLVYFFTQSSSMISMFMSIDRAIVIADLNNKKKKSLSSPANANKLFLIILFSIGLINSHFIIYTHLVVFGELDKFEIANSTTPTLNASSDLLQNSSLLSSSNVSHKMVKTCYAEPGTWYFLYLANFFPW
jgi:hypothetical protein